MTTQALRVPLPPSTPQRLRDESHALEQAQELAQEFAQEAGERDRLRRLPWEEIERYTASGLGTISVPRHYGGLDASYVSIAKIFTVLCAADPALGQIPQNHFAVLQNLRDHGNEKQKKRWFNDVLQGHRIGNAGPERKNKAAQLHHASAFIHEKAGKLFIRGSRHYSTGALFAHWIPFRAQHIDGSAVQVWVRHDAPGVELIDDWNSFGQKITASGSVHFHDVPISEQNIVRLPQYDAPPTLSGPFSQLLQASIDTGIAQAALKDTLHFVRTHSRPWVDSSVSEARLDPYIIFDVGALQVEVDTAYASLLHAAAQLDHYKQQPITARISAQASIAVAHAKVLSTEAALHSSEKLLELAGSAATRAAHQLDRHWRNARVHTLHDPVRWKYQLIGNYLLNDQLPARHQWN